MSRTLVSAFLSRDIVLANFARNTALALAMLNTLFCAGVLPLGVAASANTHTFISIPWALPTVATGRIIAQT